jgi:plastocyanin
MRHDLLNCSPSVRAMAFWLLLCGATLGAATCGSKPVRHTVTMESTSFEPDVLTVNVGDTIVWLNKDMFPHTATSAGRFDSGSIAVNGSWQYTPSEPAEIEYLCTLHPGMKARLLVK